MSVSAIIANCNREDLIGVALDNLLQQTMPPHQIIVVDDGSTDRSVEVVHSFGAKVQLIQQRNQGPDAARSCEASSVPQANTFALRIVTTCCRLINSKASRNCWSTQEPTSPLAPGRKYS